MFYTNLPCNFCFHISLETHILMLNLVALSLYTTMDHSYMKSILCIEILGELSIYALLLRRGSKLETLGFELPILLIIRKHQDNRRVS